MRSKGVLRADAPPHLHRHPAGRPPHRRWRSTRWTCVDYNQRPLPRDRRRAIVDDRRTSSASSNDRRRSRCPPLRGRERRRRSARSTCLGIPGRPCSSISKPSRSTRRTALKARCACPVQCVNRPNRDFRGFSGTIASGGEIAVATTVVAPPSRKTSKVREPSSPLTATLQRARRGAGRHASCSRTRSTSSRGDVLVHPDRRPTLARPVRRPHHLDGRGRPCCRASRY